MDNNKEYIKINEQTIGLIETVPATVLPTKAYDINFLKQQKINIEAQRTQQNEQRDKEITEVDALLAEAEKLGLKVKDEAVADNAEANVEEPL